MNDIHTCHYNQIIDFPESQKDIPDAKPFPVKCCRPIWKGDKESKYCVFHSQNVDKLEEFSKQLKHLMDNKLYDFTGFVFPKDFPKDFFSSFLDSERRAVEFINATFNGEIDFSFKTFTEVKFIKSTFHKCSFVNTRFEADPWFINCIFNDKACFQSAIADYASFHGSTFQSKADFSYTKFHLSGSFQDSTFENIADFNHSQSAFHAHNTKFKQKFIGRSMRFLEDSFIQGCHFHQNTNLDDIAILGRLRISTSTFHNPIHINNAIISGTLQIANSIFKNSFWMVNAITKNAHIKFLGNKNNLMFKDQLAEFAHTDFSGTISSHFENIDLSRANFQAANIEKIRFINVQWDEEGKAKRSRIFNERNLKNILGTNKKTVEQIYHQLVTNYDSHREYDQAGRFFVREKELQRQRGENRIAWLHRWINNYGQNYGLPLVWIGYLLLVFGLLMYGCENTFKTTSLNFWNIVGINLNIILGTQPTAGTISPLGISLFNLQRFIVYFLISMSALAIRRKFKR